MTRKIIFVALIVIVFFASFGGYAAYRLYRRHVAALEAQRRQALIKPPEEVKITLLEGWTIRDNANYLEKKSLVLAQDYTEATHSFDHLAFDFLSTVPKSHDLEGFLFPDTYQVEKETTATAIITKQLKNFEKKLTQATANNREVDSYVYQVPGFESLHLSNSRGLTLYEIITLASIVEKETGIDLSKLGENQTERLDQERKIIAGVFLNRLVIGQALESDATINYVTGKSAAQASANDLTINSPYNTYKYAGLPPGPIANPSLSSIIAVLQPTKTDYFYFFHKQPSGEVVYSKTFEEHREKKFRYLQ